ncbi:MAG: hypothetical protein V7606_3652 [Burkholderiales bacterium]
MQELDRAKIIEAYAKSEIRAVAALRLQISTRPVRRLQAWFAVVGVSGMISGRAMSPLSLSGAKEVLRERQFPLPEPVGLQANPSDAERS